jgi:hypothetical protein
MTMASATQPVSPIPKKKTVHVVVFDVSGSMQAPLKLRSNSRGANKGSGDLDPKRVQTVFDVICRLAEDGIGAAKDQDMYVAVLCFGLDSVRTCDLLVFLEERTKVLDLLGGTEDQSTTELKYDHAKALLTASGIYYAERFINEVPSPRGQQLYTVVGHEPLVKLLARSGAPYCEKYVQENLTAERAGKYFMSFAIPERAQDLHALVRSLPNACKDQSHWTGVSGFASYAIPGAGFILGGVFRFAADYMPGV